MSIFFSKQPLVLNVELAETIGLNEAIVLQQLHYWIDKSSHVHEGRRWVYNTYPEWQKQFPWWSEKTIKRIILGLEEKEFLLSGVFNKLSIDRTKWYTINYDHHALRLSQTVQPMGQNDPMDEDKLSPPITRDYTETTTKDNYSSVFPLDEIPYQEIIKFLNITAEKNFNHKTELHRKHIRARWKEGATLEDFKTVIRRKVGHWKDDPKMEQYLKPDTLFSSKFDKYLNELDANPYRQMDSQQPPSQLATNAEPSYLEKLEMMKRGE